METCTIDGCSREISIKSRGWCRAHYQRWWRTGSLVAHERSSGPDRWRRKFAVDSSGCWRWTGSLDPQGYGQYGRWENGKAKTYRAHRFVYQQLVRPLIEAETLDHLCRNRACVNPDHLEPVTHAENVRRGESGRHQLARTTCPTGHPYDEANTALSARGWRICRTCRREQGRERARKLRGTRPDAVPNRRKTHCKHGHEFTSENTIHPKSGGRNCRECQRRAVRECMQRKRAAR